MPLYSLTHQVADALAAQIRAGEETEIGAYQIIAKFQAVEVGRDGTKRYYHSVIPPDIASQIIPQAVLEAEAYSALPVTSVTEQVQFEGGPIDVTRSFRNLNGTHLMMHTFSHTG